MPLTPSSVVTLPPAPRPFSGAAVAKIDVNRFLVAGLGIYEVTVAPDKTLTWRELVAPTQYAIELPAIVVDKVRGSVRTYGGHPSGFPAQPLANWQEWAISDGRLVGSGFLPVSRKAMGAISGKGVTLLVGGIDGDGRPLSRGILHSPGTDQDSAFDDSLVDYSLVEGTGVPTAPAVAMPQIVVCKTPGSRDILVLGTGYSHPSELRPMRGTPRMLIMDAIDLPYSSRQCAATPTPDGRGFVQLGGTNSNNQPTDLIVTWSGIFTEPAAIVGSLPSALIQPSAFTHSASVYVIGGYMNSGSVDARSTAECARIDFA